MSHNSHQFCSFMDLIQFIVILPKEIKMRSLLDGHKNAMNKIKKKKKVETLNTTAKLNLMNKRKREKKKLTAVGILLFVVMVALSLFTAFDCDVFGTFFDDVANDESLAICRLVVSLGLIFTSRLLR